MEREHQALEALRAEYRRLQGAEPEDDTTLLVWAAEQVALVVPRPAEVPVPSEEARDQWAARHAAAMAALNEEARR